MPSLNTRSAVPYAVYGMTDSHRSNAVLMSADARLHIGDAQFVCNFQRKNPIIPLTLPSPIPREMEARLGASGTAGIFRADISGNKDRASTN